MVFLIPIIFIILPLLGFVVSLSAYFSGKSKRGIVYSFLMALFLGLIAYNYIPPQDYDLYRHQLVLKSLIGQSWNFFLSYMPKVELELLPMLINFALSRLRDINLLQFSVVTSGYFLLFYMLYDYRKQKNIKLFPFLIIFQFTFFGFNALNFLSGLWNYIAIILFAFAIYLEYVKKAKPIFSYILYITTFFIHNSMIFPLAILSIYKMFGNKLNMKSLLFTSFIFIIPTTILGFINSALEISFLQTIEQTFNAYFTRNAEMHRYYNGFALFMEVTKLIITIIVLWSQKEDNKLEGINGLIQLLAICMLIVLPKSIVMIRFVMLIQFMGIVPFMNNFTKITKEKFAFLLVLLVLGASYGAYFVYLFEDQNFGTLLDGRIFGNIFQFFLK